MNEARERDVRRIEAFSDVVIGFSLAQVGVTLVVPAHAAELIAHRGWFIAFLWTFALVCLLWWNHHRLFRSVFVPSRLAITCNFVLLATIVLLTFLADVLNRSATLTDLAVAARLYYGALSTNFLVWSLLVAICLREAERPAEHDLVVKARRGMVVNAIAGTCLLASVFASLRLADGVVIAVVSAMVPASFLIGAGAATLLGFRRTLRTE